MLFLSTDRPTDPPWREEGRKHQRFIHNHPSAKLDNKEGGGSRRRERAAGEGGSRLGRRKEARLPRCLRGHYSTDRVLYQREGKDTGGGAGEREQKVPEKMALVPSRTQSHESVKGSEKI